MNDIPRLPSADHMSAIRNERDLHERWRALMGELGFSGRTLWVTFVLPDGIMFPHIVQVAETPTYPADADLDGLLWLCGQAFEVVGDDVTVAMLLSRPGSAGVRDSDRAWASGIVAAARARSIRTYPLHLATDEAVRVIAPDDLIGAA
ncbi:MAG TPA: hypothetical protein VK059_04530 [Nocardioidaceae bacterium]|nr:hypothetical protein [Nocardioidaceae bacterium]